MVRYFAEFTIEGKRLTTYVADGMPYTAEEIMLEHPQAIEISAEEQSLYLQGYIRGINGKPQKVVTDEEMLDEAKKRKIEEIKMMAKSKLVETDHDIVEYFELQNLTEDEYNNLKLERQTIRDYRDKLIFNVNTCDSIDMLEQIKFNM